jgi:hypothetical protein
MIIALLDWQEQSMTIAYLPIVILLTPTFRILFLPNVFLAGAT